MTSYQEAAMPVSSSQGNNLSIGGDVSGSAIAVGTGARAWIAPATIAALRQRGANEFAERLRDLEQALALDGERLGDAAGPVREQAEAVGDELARQSPRKSVVANLLHGLSEHAQSATAVVNAVHSLLEAVHRLL